MLKNFPLDSCPLVTMSSNTAFPPSATVRSALGPPPRSVCSHCHGQQMYFTGLLKPFNFACNAWVMSFRGGQDTPEAKRISTEGLAPIVQLQRNEPESEETLMNQMERWGVSSTHAWTDTHESKTLILILVRPLHGDHVQCCLRDFVRWHWQYCIPCGQLDGAD